MDFDTQRVKRMQALDEKKKRLEEMRKRKQEKSKSQADSDHPAEPGSATKSKDDLNDLIDSLLASPAQAEETKAPESPVKQRTRSVDESAPSTPMRKPTLSIVKDVVSIIIAPRVSETYSKAVQTESTGTEQEDIEIHLPLSTPTSRHRRLPSRTPTRKQVAQLLSDDQLSEFKFPSTSSTDAPIPVPKPALTNEKKAEILSSEKFGSFLRHQSKVLERALGQSEAFDIFIDYGTARDKRDASHAGAEIGVSMEFQSDATNGRAVMDLEWSPHYSELFLGAFGSRAKRGLQFASSHADAEPEGSLSVWSLALQNRPEYTFHAPSAVLSAKFHPFDAHLVVGGTYSGQILVWDLRAKTLPVQRSALASAGHTHPVYSLSIVGSSGAHELISASTDGKLCKWDLARLQDPTVSTELQCEGKLVDGEFQTAVRLPVFVTCFANAPGESRDMVLGSESGAIYRTQRQSDILQERYDAHFGVVTAMQYHPSSNRATRDLLLSASVDWTVKLWNFTTGDTPLLTLQQPTYEYISDVKWSPTHPALFGTTDSAGQLSLWNLNQSLQEPIAPGFKVSEHGLTKLAWAADGRRALIGDTAGTIRLVTISDEISKPRGDEERFLASLRGTSTHSGGAATTDASALESKEDLPIA